MAEYNDNNIFDCLNKFEETIERDKLEFKKEIASLINPLLSEFRRSEHTDEEIKTFINLIDKVLAVLKDKDAAVKELIATLTEEKCVALETAKSQSEKTYGIRKSMIRPEPKRENHEGGKNDSGYVGSTDSRVLTENGQLVTTTQSDDDKDSDQNDWPSNVDDSTC